MLNGCWITCERKGSQDLLSSIKDGRYLSQKWRMLRCGLGQRFYLVESQGEWALGSGAGKKAVQTARATTQVVDGFTLLHSKGELIAHTACQAGTAHRASRAMNHPHAACQYL